MLAPASGLRWSADHGWPAYLCSTRGSRARPVPLQGRQELATGTKRTIASDVRFTLMANSLSWSPRADAVAYRTGGPLAKDEVVVVPRAGGAVRIVADNPAADTLMFDVEAPVWDDQGRHVYFTRDGVLWRAAADGSGAAAFASMAGREIDIVAARQQRLASTGGGRFAVVLISDPATKRVGFARVDLGSGKAAPIVEEDKRYGGYGTDAAISPDGTAIAYVAEDALQPADLYVLAGDLATPRRVSSVAPALGNHVFGRAEVIEWRGIDGETLHGALVYPAGHVAGTPCPLIIKVYGGSSISNDLNRFGYASAAFENLQLFATRGYALLLADSKLNLGTPMVDLMKSVMPGINRAVDLGVADPQRIGVTGHSYGGYSTLSLIAQSPRFKAAVMRAGMGDLVSGYGQLADDGTNYGLVWAETGQGRMGGSPWEFRERYLENSPFFYLDRVQTPLLIIHGSKDDAVPVYLADGVFTGLRRLGKTVSYARYEGESHWEGTWHRANQLDALNRVIAWFDRYLKGESR
jgi:dipeptidyl aminopeptidase/acylaminoacyl peptidase